MQKILIVEDDYDIQDILKNHLIDVGYAKVFTRNKVVTYIKLIDKHNIVYLSIEEDFAFKVFKLAA